MYKGSGNYFAYSSNAANGWFNIRDMRYISEMRNNSANSLLGKNYNLERMSFINKTQ